MAASGSSRECSSVDPRTPVIVGVGQFTENIDDPGYRGMSAVELATAAARAALTDTGADEDAVAKAIDVVVGLRQFEISGPMPTKLGKSNNYPRSVMQRVGADPARAVLEPVGGQGPQKLVTEFGGAIAAGKADVVMIIGSEPPGRRLDPSPSGTTNPTLPSTSTGSSRIAVISCSAISASTRSRMD